MLRGRFSARSAGRSNGAIARSSRASTATRSIGCAPRSSRSARPTSCGFSSEWQHVDPVDRLAGLDGLRETLDSAGRLRACRRGLGTLGASCARRGLRPVDAGYVVFRGRSRLGAPLAAGGRARGTRAAHPRHSGRAFSTRSQRGVAGPAARRGRSREQTHRQCQARAGRAAQQRRLILQRRASRERVSMPKTHAEGWASSSRAASPPPMGSRDCGRCWCARPAARSCAIAAASFAGRWSTIPTAAIWRQRIAP